MNIFHYIMVAPWILVAGIFLYHMAKMAMESHRTLNDDFARADQERVKNANESLKMARIISPIFIGVLLIAVLYLTTPVVHVNIVGVGLFAGGLLFSYIAVIVRNIEMEKQNLCTGRTTGKVVDICECEDSEGSTTYRPVICYTVNETEYVETAGIGTDKKHVAPIGSNVDVFYNPMDPETMLIPSDITGSNMIFWVFMGFGVVMMIVGCVLFKVM